MRLLLSGLVVATSLNTGVLAGHALARAAGGRWALVSTALVVGAPLATATVTCRRARPGTRRAETR